MVMAETSMKLGDRFLLKYIDSGKSIRTNGQTDIRGRIYKTVIKTDILSFKF